MTNKRECRPLYGVSSERDIFTRGKRRVIKSRVIDETEERKSEIEAAEGASEKARINGMQIAGGVRAGKPAVERSRSRFTSGRWAEICENSLGKPMTRRTRPLPKYTSRPVAIRERKRACAGQRRKTRTHARTDLVERERARGRCCKASA